MRPATVRKRATPGRAGASGVAMLAVGLALSTLSPGITAARSGPEAAATAGDAKRTSLAPSVPDEALARALIEEGEAQLEARLVVGRAEGDGHDASRPRRGPRRVGVLFEMAPGWHLYWRHPGDTGIAPRLDFAAPGRIVGEIAWPAPRVFEEADGLFTTYGYEGRVLLGAPLEGPEDGAGHVRVEADVLLCRTECVPASFSLSTPLEPGLPAAEQAGLDAAFTEALRQTPTPSAALGLEAEARWADAAPGADETGRILLSIRSCPNGPPRGPGAVPAAPDDAPRPPGGDITWRKRPDFDAVCPRAPSASDAPLFAPLHADPLELSGARLVSATDSGEDFTLEIAALRIGDGSEPGDGAPIDRLQGVVTLRDPQGGSRAVEVDLPIAPAEAKAGLPEAGAIGRWARIFLLALLGGLILNGMPCVLPVLAIKVVAVADLAQRDRREVRLQGLAYTLGVLGSMAILASVVVGLRAAGHSVGWGFQFQEPLFVAAISAVVVAFALNLFGVFEIELGQGRLAGLGQEASGIRRSVFEGLLAVVLATPCTAPFLGTAVGFAFASSGAGILSIFLAIGLGLASPFLAVSFSPGLARFIPRSGPWMLKLRAGLGFSLLATTLWLLWVLGQSGGVRAVIETLAALLCLAFLLWGFGQLQPLRSVWLGRAGATGLLGLSLFGLNTIELRPDP
ncbi:MAG TPA: protein-disulfide reductase DsbD domain-containing protein, partial [Myxococcota bacterium]|nr:protein-disulfide reductase DsbD domain-containing protein [Myxococcota bacterium]